MDFFKTVIFISLLIVVFTISGVIIYFSRNIETLEVINNDATSLPVALVQDTNETENRDQNLQLMLSPKSQSIRTGQTFSVFVAASSQREILAIDLVLKYNPQVLQLVSVSPGDYFTNPIIAKNIKDEQTGSIVYSIASLTPTKTQGNIAKLTFNVKGGSSQTAISILPESLASLKGAVEAKNIIQNGAYLIE